MKQMFQYKLIVAKFVKNIFIPDEGLPHLSMKIGEVAAKVGIRKLPSLKK